MSAHAANPASMWNSAPPHMTMMELDEVHVWRASLLQPSEETERLRQLLTQDEQDRASRFHFRKDRDRFIVARGILRSILGRYLKVEPARLRFEYSHYGKPRLTEEFDYGALRFNLSHSHERVLYAFARGRELGVDIEYIRQDFAGEEIARKFFSTREVADFCSLPLGQRTEAFFHCWTRKEAYVKAIGEGLSMPLDEFDVSLLPEKPAALLRNRRRPQEVRRWSLQALNVAFGYAAAIAIEGHERQLKCFDWDSPL
jgi:4'-phosphopantetheinyl transferase